MIGKLYLANIYTYKNQVPVNSVCINIARKNKDNLKQIIELAPSKELFSWYMNNKDNEDWFKEYKRQYKIEIQSNELALEKMRYIKSLLDEGKDVVLLCYCRDYKKCHRSIIGEAFEAIKYNVTYL